MKTFIENKKALSPVIATVILVSITIVVAISVSYWMGSLAGTYTRFESLDISSSYASKATFLNGTFGWNILDGTSGWNITMTLKNTGSADATLDNVFLNAKPFNAFSNVTILVGAACYNKTNSALSVAVGSGASQDIIIVILAGTEQGITFSSGLTLDVKLHSAAGKEYPKLIALT